MVPNRSLLLLLLLLLLGALGLSLIAHWRRISLWSYWAVPLGAILPWLLVTALLLFRISFIQDADTKQAAIMTALFPILGSMGCLLLSLVISLFVDPAVTAKSRFISSFAISGGAGVVFLSPVLYAVFTAE